jgi:uncharacterized protein (TIGR02757 family)
MEAAQRERLKLLLNNWLEGFDPTAWRARDPVSLVWAYEDPRDQEIAALVASSLAYGRVDLVVRAGRQALEVLGSAPSVTLAGLTDNALEGAYAGFVYRMTQGADLADLLRGVRELQAEFGSLEGAYLELGDAAIAAQGEEPGLAAPILRASALVQGLRERRIREEVARGLKYLVTDPAEGSAAKRLHLFLRWVVRGPDAVDLGCWERVSAADLRMPLDTHTARMTRYLGLLTRQTLDARAVEEVSAALRELDAADPARFDFPICHLGISGGCIHRRSEEHCPSCPLESACVLGGPQRES